MIISYFKLAIRQLLHNPFYSIINLLGLSVGFAVFFILWPFAQAELKSDQFVPGHENIFRIVIDWRWSDDGGQNWGQIVMGEFDSFVGNELAVSAPDVVAVTRCQPQANFDKAEGLGNKLVINKADRETSNARSFPEEHAVRADQNFFEFFGLAMVEGTARTALSTAGSVALSQSRARTIFGETPALNQMIDINQKPFVVSAVFEDIPSNSHMSYDLVLSNVGALERWNNAGQNPWVVIYSKLNGTDTSKMITYLNNNKKHLAAEHFGRFPELRLYFKAQPLNDIAFSNNFVFNHFEARSRLVMTILAFVSVVVLLMAWVNYVNLAISRTSSRFKEMAARRVAGARNSDVLFQFGCQAVLTNVLAALMGITFVQLARGPFETFFNIEIRTWLELDMATIIFFVSIFAIGILATAGYPAATVIRFSTKQLIAGKITANRLSMPSVLTVTQYAFALVLIAWVMVVYFELDMLLNKDIGIRKNGIIVFDTPVIFNESTISADLEALRTDMSSVPGVNSVSLSIGVPGDDIFNIEFKKTSEGIAYGLSGTAADQHFIPLYDIRLLNGRNFVADDRENVLILSEYAVNRLGFKSNKDAIGAEIYSVRDSRKYEIIGVITDFRVSPYFHSTDNTETGEKERGYFIGYDKDYKQSRRISIDANITNFNQTVARLESQYGGMFPDNPVTWSFVDDNVNRHYTDHKIIRNQLIFFTILAIGVACLGLLGMISNKVVEKTKEIGIRKILGAGADSILRVLLGSVTRHIVIAVVIALPATWYISNRYLELFAERITLHWWFYVVPVSLLAMIMIVTIASVLWKAAQSNPVEALRHE